ncbi:tyrosinase family protein [Hymenobacter sp.]|uniref:tyrosinase family protein n=1 Tax=Hymenobacter sp. TaxID=1898978 RepID=UPI00286C7953|nr:tyrosinase family protein [Hymenobacter sp.]
MKLFPSSDDHRPLQPSRRDFLRRGLLAGTGLLTAGAGVASLAGCGPSARDEAPPPPGPPAARAGGIVTRRDIGAMAPDDPNLRMLREAVQVLKKRSDRNQLDPTGWLMNGTVHSLYCTTSNYQTQIHYNWLFFPWHRAFLWALEKQLQAAINEPTLALPYWDWTKRGRQMPAHYYGADNPLLDVTRDAAPGEAIPADFIDVDAALQAPRFSSFGGFEKRDPRVPQVEGIVEQSFHNNIHNWIGGNMGAFPTAALDPIFGGHHGNVDRLWAAWLAADPAHQNPTDPLWLNYEFGFYDPTGKLIKVKVKDTVSPETMGYRFESLDFTQPTPGAIARSTEPSQAASAAGSAPVRVPEGQRQEVAAALASGRRRVILRFNRYDLPTVPLTIRVFLNQPNVDLRTAPAGENFVGTFTILPVADPVRGLEKVVTMQLALRPALAELVRQGRPVRVSVVPVPLHGQKLPTQTVQLRNARLELDD